MSNTPDSLTTYLVSLRRFTDSPAHRLEASKNIKTVADALGRHRVVNELLPYIEDLVNIPANISIVPMVFDATAAEIQGDGMMVTPPTIATISDETNALPYIDHFKKLSCLALSELASLPTGPQVISRCIQAMGYTDEIKGNLAVGVSMLVPDPIPISECGPVLKILLAISKSADVGTREAALRGLERIAVASGAELVGSPLLELMLARAERDLAGGSRAMEGAVEKAANIRLIALLLGLLFDLKTELKLNADLTKELNPEVKGEVKGGTERPGTDHIGKGTAAEEAVARAKSLLTRRWFRYFEEEPAYTVVKRELGVTAPVLIAGWLRDEELVQGYIGQFADSCQDALDENDLAFTSVERLLCRIPDFYFKKELVPDDCRIGVQVLLTLLVHLFNRHVLPHLDEQDFARHHPTLSALAGAGNGSVSGSGNGGGSGDGSGAASCAHCEHSAASATAGSGRDLSGGTVRSAACARCGAECEFQWPRGSHPYHVFDLGRVVSELQLPLIRPRYTRDSSSRSIRAGRSPKSESSVRDYCSIVSQWVWSYLKRLKEVEGILRVSMVSLLPLLVDLVLNYSTVEDARCFLAEDVFVVDNPCYAELMLHCLALNAFCLAHSPVSLVMASKTHGRTSDYKRTYTYELKGRTGLNQPLIELLVDQIKTGFQFDLMQCKLQAAMVCVQMLMLIKEVAVYNEHLRPILVECLADRNWHIVVSTVGAFRLLSVELPSAPGPSEWRRGADLFPFTRGVYGQRTLLPTGAAAAIAEARHTVIPRVLDSLLIPHIYAGLQCCLEAVSMFQPCPEIQSVQICWWRVRVAALHVLAEIPHVDVLLQTTGLATAADNPRPLIQVLQERLTDSIAAVRKCAPVCILRLAERLCCNIHLARGPDERLAETLLEPLLVYSPAATTGQKEALLALAAEDPTKLPPGANHKLANALVKAVSDTRIS
ncbi:hypothetical protein GNI_143530 [Gregarina niphandrodes]|uniref:HEAT repeat protein n=1 Tax=Gregarina niphandrodes TaxID=110365 RepID=A0A023B0Q1_GRENI|nr:hypothetical protein GNI_143530 [Gregarina niphandrodes]EZG44800.1 hypothetical protein GNI_143530 [Gregarina niphandrodes]|eukprot:XP_011132659.1 hypothetical protein GNI_143530 [Gregarina niphandrodes]